MKKAEERYYFDIFAERLPDLKISDVRDFERPDFLCVVDGLLTGVEMTRLFFPSAGKRPPQAAEAYRDRLSSMLNEEHTRRKLPALNVAVHLFAEEKLFQPEGRELLVNSLVDFIARNIPSLGGSIELDWESLSPSLSAVGVERISILRHPSFTKAFWSLPYASFIPESDSALVQAIITEKSELVSEYRKNAPHLWLLIISGTGGLHSIVDFDGDVLSASYRSDFDRIFLFRTFGSALHELNQVGEPKKFHP